MKTVKLTVEPRVMYCPGCGVSLVRRPDAHGVAAANADAEKPTHWRLICLNWRCTVDPLTEYTVAVERVDAVVTVPGKVAGKASRGVLDAAGVKLGPEK